MSLALYPSQIYGLTLKVVKTPEFSTIVQSSPNKVETRIAQRQNPVWRWNLNYDQLYNDLTNPSYAVSELETLMGFYLAVQGQLGEFLFEDPEDNTVGSVATPQTLQLVNDGTNYYTPLQRNLGAQFLEDLTDINKQGAGSYFPAGGGALNKIFANGVQKNEGTHFSVLGPGLSYAGFSSAAMYLNWGASAPTPPITGNFKFYFRVRFEEDKQDFEKFLRRLWTIGGTEGSRGSGTLTLVSSRAAV